MGTSATEGRMYCYSLNPDVDLFCDADAGSGRGAAVAGAGKVKNRGDCRKRSSRDDMSVI